MSWTLNLRSLFIDNHKERSQLIWDRNGRNKPSFVSRHRFNEGFGEFQDNIHRLMLLSNILSVFQNTYFMYLIYIYVSTISFEVTNRLLVALNPQTVQTHKLSYHSSFFIMELMHNDIHTKHENILINNSNWLFRQLCFLLN